ncbi:MAG: sigma-70 family RNA polymerase sigma factor [Candidatus Latescibacterota bacterium]
MDEARSDNRRPVDLTPSLVVRLRDGHSEAGKVLDQLYRSRLVRFSLGYLGNREEAEDAAQDVFYRVINSPTVPDNFRAWIYEICRNCCLDRLRAKNRRPDDQTLPTTSYFADHMTGNLTRLIKGERKAQLWQRLAALPADQREVLLLRYTEGLSRAEISQVLGIPENLVKHRIYNGLEKLRKDKSFDPDR